MAAGDTDTDIEGLVWFLLRLYACYLEWYARSRGFSLEARNAFPHMFEMVRHQAVSYKTRLFLTVPHDFRVAPRPDMESASSLKIKCVRVPGTTRTQHFVLYPGARRELCLRHGRNVSVMRWFDRPQLRRIWGLRGPTFQIEQIFAPMVHADHRLTSLRPSEAETSYLNRAPP